MGILNVYAAYDPFVVKKKKKILDVQTTIHECVVTFRLRLLLVYTFGREVHDERGDEVGERRRLGRKNDQRSE